jgi:hypothetical protein
MTALMDPMLTPVQGLIEDLLAGHSRTVTENAGEALARAQGECKELRGWFDEESDSDLQGMLRSLAAIEQQQERQSHYDVLDVAEKADRLFYECHRLKEIRLDRLKERLARVGGRWEGYHSFWSAYSYHSLFGRFREMLAAARGNLEKAVHLSQEMRGEAFRAASTEVAEAEARIKEMQPLVAKMIWTGTALDGIRTFGRKLVYTELLLGILGLALFFLFQSYLADGKDIPGQLFADSWSLKKGISVVTLLIAPVMALALTLWEINDR